MCMYAAFQKSVEGHVLREADDLDVILFQIS